MRRRNRDQTFIFRTVEVGLAAARSRSGSNDHSRRILSRALGIPKSRIRVEKPRIGGGFGAKQTAVCEMYPAFVTMKTGRPAKINYTREEAQIAGSPRHEMEIRVRLGASSDGTIRALDLYTLSNTGPFGAKSIGEIVINTPAPAIAHAIHRATGVWHRELPITPEKIAMSVQED